MANPTSRVSSQLTFFDDVGGLWPLAAGSVNTRAYQSGQMLGVMASGYASDMDDSAAKQFLGIMFHASPLVSVAAGDAAGAKLVRFQRPRTYTMALYSGTASRATDLGKPVYAVDAGHVTMDPSGLTYKNLCGFIEDVSSTTQPDALTGSYVVVRPPSFIGDPVGAMTVTGTLTLAGKLVMSDIATLAAAGSAQGDAGAISTQTTYVTAADGTKGVVLPAAAAGMYREVYNTHATNGLKIYPASGDDINDGTTDASITIEGKTLAIFRALDSATWAAIYTVNT